MFGYKLVKKFIYLVLFSGIMARSSIVLTNGKRSQKIRSLTVQNKKFALFLSKTRIVFVGNSSTCIFTLIHSILKRISGVYQAQILSNEKPLFIVLILNFLIRTSSILPTFKAAVQSSYFKRRIHFYF